MSPVPNEPLILLADMAKSLGIKYKRLGRMCREGRLGVSGSCVKLARWLTESGWATTHAAIKRFRQRLNDFQYVPGH